MERFNGYLKHSFNTPLAATLKQVRLTLDVETAIAQFGLLLEDVTNQRIHGTTKQTPTSFLDGLLHHAHIVKLAGNSYRLRGKKAAGIALVKRKRNEV